MLSFEVPGDPIPWKRARRRGTRYFTAKEEQTYRASVAWEAKRAMVRAGLHVVDDPLKLFLRVRLACPSSWSQRRQEEAWYGKFAPSRRPDLDNFVKVVLDALNDLVWRDDSQVVRLDAGKEYAQHPGLVVLVTASGARRPPR